MQKFVGETALWRPKSGFPHTPFRESHKRNWKKLFNLLPFFLEKLSHGLGAHFPTKICIEPFLTKISEFSMQFFSKWACNLNKNML